MYESALYAEFPHCRAEIDRFADVVDSAADTVYVHKGRPISNVLFYRARYILSCLTHLPPIDTILEIGGGYGAPARLWMLNPIRPPQRHVIVDIPES